MSCVIADSTFLSGIHLFPIQSGAANIGPDGPKVRRRWAHRTRKPASNSPNLSDQSLKIP
jgi:hypothetical protein